VQGTVAGGPVGWLACCAACPMPVATATADETTATRATVSKARIFVFMVFPRDIMGLNL